MGSTFTPALAYPHGQEHPLEEGSRGLPYLLVQAVVSNTVDVGQAVVASDRHVMTVGRQLNLHTSDTALGQQGALQPQL